jgi:hypothetical protein
MKEKEIREILDNYFETEDKIVNGGWFDLSLEKQQEWLEYDFLKLHMNLDALQDRPFDKNMLRPSCILKDSDVKTAIDKLEKFKYQSMGVYEQTTRLINALNIHLGKIKKFVH